MRVEARNVVSQY